MGISNTVCACCPGGGGGNCGATPAILCVNVTGCFTDLSGVVIQVVDSVGNTQTCTTLSSGFCSSCFTIVNSGTVTITIISAPSKWVIPAPFVFSISCNTTPSHTFTLSANTPDWQCCCPGQTIPFPSTLAVTTPLGNLTLTGNYNTGWSGCQTVPGVLVSVNTGFPNFCNVTTTGSTTVLWSVTSGGLASPCFQLNVTAWACVAGGPGGGSACLPAAAIGGCAPVTGNQPVSASCSLTGTCSPILVTGTIPFSAATPVCNPGGGALPSLLQDIYGIASFNSTVSI